jgi:hypothetical protein
MPDHENPDLNKAAWIAAQLDARPSAIRILYAYPRHRHANPSPETLAPEFAAFSRVARREFNELADCYGLHNAIGAIIESLSSVACYIMDSAAAQQGLSRDPLLSDVLKHWQEGSRGKP